MAPVRLPPPEASVLALVLEQAAQRNLGPASMTGQQTAPRLVDPPAQVPPVATSSCHLQGSPALNSCIRQRTRRPAKLNLLQWIDGVIA